MSGVSGHLSLRAALRDHGRTVLAAQSFRAPYHISKPYWDHDARALLVQVVNPTAGILAGDRLESEIVVDTGAALLVTTPSASRLFQMRGGVAECRQHFVVSAGAWLEVRPEPLVPHRGSSFLQATTIDVEPGGALFFLDQLMPGRIGHDEMWEWQRLRLALAVRYGGELVLRERLDQSGAELRALAEAMSPETPGCFANAVLIAGEPRPSAAWRTPIASLHRDGLWVGVSELRRAGWTIKLIAPDALRLRQALRDVRKILADYFPRLSCDSRKL